MKRFLLVFALIILIINLNAQTKQETIDWLKYYLNKYANTEYTFNKYRVINQTFSFANNKLVHWYLEKSLDGKEIMQQMVYIDLSELIKVSISVDTSNSFLPSLTVDLDFSDNNFDTLKKAIVIHRMPDLKIINNDRFQFGYTFLFDDSDILDNDLPNKIKKAIEHLATLEGAHLIKEVF